VLATIVFTTVAGMVFAEFRRRSGSLAAPIGLHWVTNGLGVLAAARVWAITPSDVKTPDARTPDASAPFGPSNQSAWQRNVRRRWSSRS
jgi:hypothetical protein